MSLVACTPEAHALLEKAKLSGKIKKLRGKIKRAKREIYYSKKEIGELKIKLKEWD